MSHRVEEHHKKRDVVYDRPDYRDARWDRAKKVYTVNQESKYLLVQNVHALGVTKDLIELFSLYGDIEEYRTLDDYPSEEYCDVYWIKFTRIGSARMAKKKLDNWSFYGKCLHVCYAPEYESVYETRNKLVQRKKIIAQKTRGDIKSSITNGSSRTTYSSPVGSVLPSGTHVQLSDPIVSSASVSQDESGSEGIAGKLLLPHLQPSHNVLVPNVFSSTHQHRPGTPQFELISKFQTSRVDLSTSGLLNTTDLMENADAGDMSVDKSIQSIRQHIQKVWEGSAAGALSSLVPHPKKRRRI